MSPELLAQLGLATGSALASGLRVYGTVAALGDMAEPRRTVVAVLRRLARRREAAA